MVYLASPWKEALLRLSFEFWELSRLKAPSCEDRSCAKDFSLLRTPIRVILESNLIGISSSTTL
jgi:hypothetical protein